MRFLLLLPLFFLSVTLPAQRDCFVTHGLETAAFGGYNPGSDRPHRDLEHLRAGWSATVISEFHLTHRLSVVSGIGLSALGYRTVETGAGSGTLRAINNTAYSLSVPLDGKYRWANRRGGLYTRLGLGYEIAIGYRAALAGEDAGAVSSQEAQSHRAYLRGNPQVLWSRLAMGYEFPAVRNFVFYAEPLLRYSITPIEVGRTRNRRPDGTNFRGRALLLGLSLGVRI